jgi:hypothetical protein
MVLTPLFPSGKIERKARLAGGTTCRHLPYLQSKAGATEKKIEYFFVTH